MTNTASYIATKCISYKKNITPKQIYDIVSAEFNTAPNQNKFDSIFKAMNLPGMKLASYEIFPNLRNKNQ